MYRCVTPQENSKYGYGAENGRLNVGTGMPVPRGQNLPGKFESKGVSKSVPGYKAILCDHGDIVITSRVCG